MSESSNYLDPSVLKGLSQFLDEEKQLHLLDRYLYDSQQLIEQLVSALTDNDATEARRMVHSLKSTSANVGALPLSSLSKELEMLAAEEKLDEVRSRVDELIECFAHTSEAINNLDIMQSRQAS